MRVDGQARRISQFDYEERLPSGSGPVVWNVPIHLRCIETEEGVAWLNVEHGRIGGAVIVHYRDHPSWSAGMQAELLHVCTRTLWRDLEKAHNLLLGYFVDRAAGIFPQMQKLTEGKRVALRMHSGGPAGEAIIRLGAAIGKRP